MTKKDKVELKRLKDIRDNSIKEAEEHLNNIRVCQVEIDKITAKYKKRK